METKETDSLYKDLSSGFHIPGYSADVIDFPSSGSDEYTSSDSQNEEESHDLHEVLSSGFHIPGYSADVIDFPSSGTDEYCSSDSQNDELCQNLHKDHDLYKVLSSGFHIPGYSADVIDFPSSGSDVSSSGNSDSEEQMQITELSMAGEKTEKYEQGSIPGGADVFPGTLWKYPKRLKTERPFAPTGSSGKSDSQEQAQITELPIPGEKSKKYKQGSIPGAPDVFPVTLWKYLKRLKTERPFAPTDSSSNSDSEEQMQITELPMPEEKREKYKQCSIEDAGDVFSGTSWQDSQKRKKPLTAIPVKGADFGDLSWRESGSQMASTSKSSDSEQYQQGSWRVFADADSLKMEALQTGRAFSDAPDEPQLSESSYSARVKPKTVIESGEKLPIKPDLQRYKEKGQGLVTEKMKGKTWYNTKPKSDKPQRFVDLSGVSVLRDGQVVACDMFENWLYVFSSEGRYITSHHLFGARDVAGTPDGGMVAVNRHTLYKLDKQGHVLWNVEKSQLQYPKYKGLDDYIVGVCVDSQGIIYTRLRHSVCVVDHNGHVLRHIEDNVPHPGWTYCGIAVQPWGDILLPDPDNNCIVVLTGSGEHKTTLGGPHPETGGLRHPLGIAVDSTGNVAVASLDGHTVTVYSPSGECISTWGGRGKEPGEFFLPSGIAFTPSGDIIVCDHGNQRIQIFQSPSSRKAHQRLTTPKQLLTTDYPTSQFST